MQVVSRPAGGPTLRMQFLKTYSWNLVMEALGVPCDLMSCAFSSLVVSLYVVFVMENSDSSYLLNVFK